MQVDVALFFNAESGRIEAWQLAETPATASALDINFTPAEEQQIIDVLSSTPSTMAEGDECALYINADDFSTFLDALLNELDQKVLLDTTNGGQQALRDIASNLVKDLLNSQVNDTYSVLGLVDFAYQDHLLGNEQPGGEAVSSAIASIRNDNLLGTLVGAQVNALLEADSAFMVLAEQVACVPSELIKQEGSNVIGGLVVGPLLLGKVKTLTDLVELLTGSMLGLDLGATVAGLVPSIELFGQPVPQLAAGALETLSTDTNAADDHHLVATATATIPTEEEKPSGDGSQGGDGGSTGGNGGGNGNGSGAGSGSGTSNKPGGPSGTGKPSGGKLVGTGDASMAASLAALLAGSGTIAAGIWARMTGRGDQE